MPSLLARWSGTALVIGGVFWTLLRFMMAFDISVRASNAYQRLLVLPILLLAFGFLAMFSLDRLKHQQLRNVSLAVGLAGLLEMLIGNLAAYWFYVKWLFIVFFLGALTLSLGLILLAFSSVRANRFGFDAAMASGVAVILVSPFLALLSGRFFYLLYGIGWAIVGILWMLWGGSLYLLRSRPTCLNLS
jgi:hypothetical protein